ncbi:MAG TPA: hypothetical protein VEQ11_01720 [Chloroflexota bacterium]|nr:hypothetical protein [Chloroflexota bacterium]
MPRMNLAVTLIMAFGLLAAACGPAATPAPKTEAKPTEAPKAAAPVAAQPTAAPTAAKPVAPPATAAPAAAAPPKVDTKAIEDFYKGKTVRIVVGFAAGGGYDTYARAMARYMGKHIPGNPSIVVENQVGAGSLLAANSVYKTAPKDGTVMVHFIGGMITQKLVVENPAVEFDPLQFSWLGAPTPDTPACAVRKESGFTSLEEARSKELIVGGTAPGSTTDDVANTLRAIGLKMKVIDGYDGTAKIRLAADSGEVMGGCWGWESISVTWKDGLDKGEVLVIAQGGPNPHPDLKDVPMMQNLAKTDAEKRLIDAGIVGPGQISRVFALPPGVPAERVQAMRDAFMETLKDPELLAESQKTGLAISPIGPDEIYQRIKEMQELPADLKQTLRAAVSGS